MCVIQEPRNPQKYTEIIRKKPLHLGVITNRSLEYMEINHKVLTYSVLDESKISAGITIQLDYDNTILGLKKTQEYALEALFFNQLIQLYLNHFLHTNFLTILSFTRLICNHPANPTVLSNSSESRSTTSLGLSGLKRIPPNDSRDVRTIELDNNCNLHPMGYQQTLSKGRNDRIFILFLGFRDFFENVSHFNTQDYEILTK